MFGVVCRRRSWRAERSGSNSEESRSIYENVLVGRFRLSATLGEDLV